MKFERETQLYAPVKQLFENSGFEVKSEVADIDVAAVKEESLVAVELKLRLNLDVIIQAADRQRTADAVYIAVPAQRRSRRTEKIKTVLKRLEIGLIYVGVDGTAKVVFEAKPFDVLKWRARGKNRRKEIENEFNLRLGDPNTGGSSRTKLMTAYRQNALVIVGILNEIGQGSAVKIREMGGCEKTYSIIHDNHYGWFEKVGRGVYTLTESGRLAYDENKTYINMYKEITDEEN